MSLSRVRVEFARVSHESLSVYAATYMYFSLLMPNVSIHAPLSFLCFA